jgi:hypothetical protein
MMLSRHFKISVGLLALLSLLLFGLYRYVAMRIKEVVPSRPTSVLPKNDKELVSFNEKTHTLTVITAQKTVKEYAVNPVVELRQNGDVVIQRHLAGLSFDPFLGGGYADTGRLFFGANFLHLSRLNVGGAVGWTADNRYASVQPFLSIGYNVYSNTSINGTLAPLSIGSAKGIEIGGFVSVKL